MIELINFWDGFCKANNLPCVSADEILRGMSKKDKHYKTVKHFYKLWLCTEEAERDKTSVFYIQGVVDGFEGYHTGEMWNGAIIPDFTHDQMAYLFIILRQNGYICAFDSDLNAHIYDFENDGVVFISKPLLEFYRLDGWMFTTDKQ